MTQHEKLNKVQTFESNFYVTSKIEGLEKNIESLIAKHAKLSEAASFR